MTQEVVSTMRLSCCMHDGTNSPGTCVEATVINVCEFGMKTEKQFEETCMLSYASSSAWAMSASVLPNENDGGYGSACADLDDTYAV